MIDIGLSKLMVIGVVALVVIGPEKLPKVARMAGSLFGRAQRYINDVKAEVTREMALDEMQKIHQDVRQSAAEIGRNMTRSMHEARQAARNEWTSVNNDFNGLSSSANNEMQGTEGYILTAASSAKVKTFRRKRLSRTTGVPAWYSRRSGQRTRVISAAARVARFSPGSRPGRSFHL
jgi:sec-independent protein translocase protein TatB